MGNLKFLVGVIEWILKLKTKKNTHTNYSLAHTKTYTHTHKNNRTNIKERDGYYKDCINHYY